MNIPLAWLHAKGLKKYDFDGIIGVLLCTQERVSKRAFEYEYDNGPAGARMLINEYKNVDADLYHNLFAVTVGVSLRAINVALHSRLYF